MTPSFIHLRCHSAYSLLEGAVKVKELIKLAKKNAMPALGIADTRNLFGALEFSLSCASEGIQPLIACQMAVAFESPKKVSDKAKLDTLILIAKTDAGYRNLLKLVSKSFIETPETETPHVTLSDLEAHGSGLIALTGGVQGWIGRLILENRVSDAKAATQKLQSLFPGHLYMEIARLGTPQEALTEPHFLDFAYDLNIPLVATNEVFFADASMYEAHDALLAVAEGSYVSQTERRKLTPHYRFKSQEEMGILFQDIPEALANTVAIAQRCAFMPKIIQPILPPFETESGRAEPEELAIQAQDGLIYRLKNQVYKSEHTESERAEIYETYKKRLDHELAVIVKMGYPGYFLIVSDFIKWAKSQGIPVGPGRGSGAGSIVAWSLTITDIDPIRFNLLFERFLNPERVSMPDFDIDFCQERRDEVISYVQKKYGSDRVAQIITFGKLQARAVLRDVGRVLQMPYNQVDRICKLIPNNPANPVTLEEALEVEPKLKEMRDSEEDVQMLIAMGIKLEGLYRHASTHAAGVVIGDRPLNELVPLYRDPKSTMPVTQFNMKYVEQAGLVKFDFLGLKTLTVIAKTCDMVQQRGGPSIDISKISLEDKATFDLLKRVETTGVFQLESTGMRDVVRKLQPDRFEEIIALVALYRPGPMDDIPRYLACKHGEEAITYPHPMLTDILKETFGVMVYQEQVMQIAQVMGGYSLGAADLLRRAMGKKIKEEMDSQRAIFVGGATEMGVDKPTADLVFDQMAKFAGYGFNKSHSAPYGLLAYQTAYLKANYPVDLFAATMTLDITNTDKLAVYKQELTQMGIVLLPPDINKSKTLFSVEAQPDGTLAVRYALAALKNVGEGAIEAIMQERDRGGPYKDLLDFICRLPARSINKRQFENLIFAGTFDSIHPNRAQILENLDTLMKLAVSEGERRSSAQGSLFDLGNSLPQVQLAPCGDWVGLEKLNKEFEAIGFYLSAHPLDSYLDVLEGMNITRSCDLQESPDGNLTLAGIVNSVQTRTAKSGNRFAFVQFSDGHGAYEVTLFSEILASAGPLLESGAPLLITINKRQDGEFVRLTAQSIKPLEGVGQKFSQDMRLQVFNMGALDTLKGVLSKDAAGHRRVILSLHLEDQRVVELDLGKRYGLSTQTRAMLRSIEGIKVS